MDSLAKTTVPTTAAVSELPAFDWSSVHNNTLSVLIVRRMSGHAYADRIRSRIVLSQQRPFHPTRFFENVADGSPPTVDDLAHLTRFYTEETNPKKTGKKPSLAVFNTCLLSKDELKHCRGFSGLLDDGHFRHVTFVVEDASLEKFDDATLAKFDLIVLSCPARPVRRSLFARLGGPGDTVDEFDAHVRSYLPPRNRNGAIVVDQRDSPCGKKRRFFSTDLNAEEERDTVAFATLAASDADVAESAPRSLAAALAVVEKHCGDSQSYCTLL